MANWEKVYIHLGSYATVAEMDPAHLQGNQSCMTCHDGEEEYHSGVGGDCSKCHQDTYTDHNFDVSCSSCHGNSQPSHENLQMTCTECHESVPQSSGNIQEIHSDIEYTCSTCHDNPQYEEKHTAVESTCSDCHSGANYEAEHIDVEKACSTCHEENTQNTDTFITAIHDGQMPDPSKYDDTGMNKCSGCHNDASTSYENSMHHKLWGERTWLAKRAGVESYELCPQELQDGWSNECTSCHATCGDCHVSTPNSAGGGLIRNSTGRYGHMFRGEPHDDNQCMACHGSRIGADFRGEIEGNTPDYHKQTLFFDCMNCHDKTEMHADASGVEDRYHYENAPSCEDCHSGVSTDNTYHQMHWDDLQCQICHSQQYNNCTACHVDGAYLEDPIYQANNPAVDFRIGYNPLQPERRFKYSLVRHIPIARDTYDNWDGVTGLSMLAGYDSHETWKYTTPHSIQRWTDRTQTTGGCASNCHLGGSQGSPNNANIYLFRDYVEMNWADEAQANEGVYVDEHLPQGWQ